MSRTSREGSLRRKSGSQSSLKKKDSENDAEKKRLIQEETVEQGSVSGFSATGCFLVISLLQLCKEYTVSSGDLGFNAVDSQSVKSMIYFVLQPKGWVNTFR